MTANPPLWLLVTLQAVVSAASLVVEIVAGRLLAPYVGMSLYTWTSIIAVVLAGFSAGHWWGGGLAGLAADKALRRTGWVLLAAGVATALAVVLLHLLAGPVLGGIGHPVWGIAVLAGLVFFLPSLFAGVPAPVLAQIATQGAAPPGRALGAMFAAGALGAIGGTLLAGFLFISWLGSGATMAVVTAGYVLCALVLFRLARAPVLPVLAGSIIALGMAGAGLATPNPCTVESRYFCLRSEDISADPASPVRLMAIDHLVHGISARDAPLVMFTEHAAMLDALARARAPRSDFTSFFIGGGTYSIPRAFALRGTGARTVAEIDPAVTAMAVRDFWFDPTTASILHEDARRALLTRPEARYDVIVGDAFTDVAVPPHLITEEFFRLAAARLTKNGTFLINVIDYEGRLYAIASVVATLKRVFPVVEVWTDTAPPAPGGRIVFVVVAGQTRTPQSRLAVPAPELTEFGALDSGWVEALAHAKGIILTDDYAPIDRMLGRPD